MSRSMSYSFAALGLISMLVGCSSKETANTGSDSGSSSSSAAISDYCDARRAHSGTCDPATAPRHYDECLATEGACALTVFNSAALATFETCMRTFTCSGSETACKCQKSDDACFAEAAKTAPASANRDAYESACRRKLEECGKQGQADGGITDDWCTSGDIGWEMFATATYDALTPCFSGACVGVNTCLRAKRKALCEP